MSSPTQVKQLVYRSVEEAQAECTREFQVRERCFPRWVSEGKLCSVDATDRLERMRAACFWLDHLLKQAKAKLEAAQDAPVEPEEPDPDKLPI